MIVPMLGLWLLLAHPVDEDPHTVDLDHVWQHNPSHFWLVLVVAGVNLVLGC